MNLNKVILAGRLTANPELRRTPGGTAVSTFSIATNRVWTDKVKGKQEETEFHNIVAWGRTAEIASQFLVKGQEVMIEGRLKTRSWQDKQGANHRATEIICDNMQMGSKPAGAGGPSGASGTWSSRPQGNATAAGPAKEGNDMPAVEEIPIINLDDEPSQSDEIPF
jgi:single-strand DNA-binding protein